MGGNEIDLVRRPAVAGIHVLAYNPLEPPRGSLRGFFDAHVPAFRFKLFGCTAHSQGGRRWVGLPARPMLDHGGNVLRDQETGKVRYQQVFAFDDDRVRTRFSDACIAALDAYTNGWDR
jgi:hypothetical protein